MENGTTPLVTITQATLTDLPAMRVLWLTMLAEQRERPFYPLPHPDDADRITQDLAVVLQSDRFYAVIARDGEAVVGFAAVEAQERRFGAPRFYAYFHGIYVITPYRHHTASLRLCLAIAAWVKSLELEVVECDNPAGYAPWWKAIPLPFKVAYSRYVASVAACTEAALAYATAHDPGALPEPPPPPLDLAAIDRLPEE